MLTATDAFQKTKHSTEINKVKNLIEQSVKLAIDQGKYTCDVGIKRDTPDYVRDEVAEWLHQLGYRTTIPKRKDTSGFDPMDYSDDIVNVDWRSDKMILENKRKQ